MVAWGPPREPAWNQARGRSSGAVYWATSAAIYMSSLLLLWHFLLQLIAAATDQPPPRPAGAVMASNSTFVLTGEARILNPGKDWADFVPGDALETTFTVFVGDSGDNSPLRVISQSQQLRRSVCWPLPG